MALPEQLRKQTEAIAAHFAASTTDDADANAAVTGDEGAENAPADENALVAPESASNEQGRPDTTSDETAEQRYRTLQGMYNADTARLRSERQQLQTRVTQLEQLLSSLSAAQPAPQTVATKLITDKDVEEYGDSIEVMRRVTREETATQTARMQELERHLRELQTNIIPRVEQVASRQALSAEQSFWSDLTSAVPNWKDINASTAFQSWLLEMDPLTGVTRQSHLENAQRNLDARRVANFFTTWQTASGHTVAQPPREAAKTQLEKQVAPGRGRSSAPPQGNQPKTYTTGDISKFFDDVRRGVYQGREPERDRIERDIFAAQRENRIVASG